VPDPPSALEAIHDYTNNRIDLSWMDDSIDETKFEVHRRVDGGAYAVLEGELPAKQQRSTT
jgi:hypothetical protein